MIKYYNMSARTAVSSILEDSIQQDREIGYQEQPYASQGVVLNSLPVATRHEVVDRFPSSYVGPTIKRNPLDIEIGEYAVPIYGLGTGFFRSTRTILQKVEEGRYIWHKGTGNPSFPNLPPLYRGDFNDYGHEIFYGTSLKLAFKTTQMHTAFESADFVNPSKLQKLIAAKKFLEIPIPISIDKSTVISVIDAFSKPWPIFDEIRIAMLNRMRIDLFKRTRGIDKSKLHDPLGIISAFQKHLGFYEVQTETDLPFRNDIGIFVLNPILFDYNFRSETSTIESQTLHLQNTFKCILIAAGITKTDTIKFPDPQNYTVKIKSKYEGDRPFQITDAAQLTALDLKLISTQFYGDASQMYNLTEVNGEKFMMDTYKLLPRDIQIKLSTWLKQQAKDLGQNMANAAMAGIDVKQTVSNKDACGGKIGDLGDAHSFTFPVNKFEAIESLIKDQQKNERAATESLLTLAIAVGAPEELMAEISEIFLVKIEHGIIEQKNFVFSKVFDKEYYLEYFEVLIRASHYVKSEYERYIASQDTSSQNTLNFEQLSPAEKVKFAKQFVPTTIATIIGHVLTS